MSSDFSSPDNRQSFSSSKASRRRKKIRIRHFILSFSASFLLLASLMAGMVVLGASPLSQQPQTLSDSSSEDFYTPQKEEDLTVLFMGMEKTNSLATTYFLIRFCPSKGSIPVFSFPPQTKVLLNGREQLLANVYQYGGYALTIKALEDTYGISIDRYVKMHAQAFLTAAQTIGSVQYQLKHDVAFQESDGLPATQLSKGIQLIDGQKALKLIAYPAYPGGELSRAEVGAELTAQIINEKLSIVNSPAIDGIFKAIVNIIQTDISYKDFEDRKQAARYLSQQSYPPAANLPLSGEFNAEGTMLTLSEDTQELLKKTYSSQTQTQAQAAG